jgi:hypothetical protein
MLCFGISSWIGVYSLEETNLSLILNNLELRDIFQLGFTSLLSLLIQLLDSVGY